MLVQSLPASSQRAVSWLVSAGEILEDPANRAAKNVEDWQREVSVRHRRIEEQMQKRIEIARDAAKAQALMATQQYRESLLEQLRQITLASCLADPHLWTWVANSYDAALTAVWDGINKELEKTLHYAFLQEKESKAAPGPQGATFMSWYYWLRRFTLHHYLPHDRSVFGKLKDPWFILIYMLTLVPIHGLRVCFFAVLLIFIRFPWPADEFQLINYILQFKGNQFLSQGFVFMSKGVVKYYLCWSSAGDVRQCIDSTGAGASQSLWGIWVDYLGSVFLVWFAFICLPNSKRMDPPEYEALQGAALDRRRQSAPKGHIRFPTSRTGGSSRSLGRCESDDLDLVRCESGDAHSDASRDEEGEEKGGRLVSLLWYDVKCFLFSLVLLAIATHFTCDLTKGLHGVVFTPQFKENTYWCMVIYALLSIPFSVFSIPIILQLLTPLEFTGYNEQGACVAYLIPAESAPKVREQRVPPAPTWCARLRRICPRMCHSLQRCWWKWKGCCQTMCCNGCTCLTNFHICCCCPAKSERVIKKPRKSEISGTRCCQSQCFSRWCSCCCPSWCFSSWWCCCRRRATQDRGKHKKHRGASKKQDGHADLAPRQLRMSGGDTQSQGQEAQLRFPCFFGWMRRCCCCCGRCCAQPAEDASAPGARDKFWSSAPACLETTTPLLDANSRLQSSQLRVQPSILDLGESKQAALNPDNIPGRATLPSDQRWSTWHRLFRPSERAALPDTMPAVDSAAPANSESGARLDELQSRSKEAEF